MQRRKDLFWLPVERFGFLPLGRSSLAERCGGNTAYRETELWERATEEGVGAGDRCCPSIPPLTVHPFQPGPPSVFIPPTKLTKLWAPPWVNFTDK